MTQERLNHLILLNTHKELLDQINVKDALFPKMTQDKIILIPFCKTELFCFNAIKHQSA